MPLLLHTSVSCADIMYLFSWFVLLLVYSGVSASDCSDNCNCSTSFEPFLGKREYFSVYCQGSPLDLRNFSLADIFFYAAPDTSTVMDSNILHQFTSLKYLRIDGGIQSLKSIPMISSLRVLQVKATPIAYVPDKVLYAISKVLADISLAYNQVELIGDSAFTHLNQLQNLNLTHNKIGKVSAAVFRDLVNLETLDLSFNYIRFIKSEDLAGLKSLRLLNLNGNNMYSLSYIELPVSGISLLVKENPLNRISWRASDDKKLASLEIGGNELSVLSRNSFVNAAIDSITISDCPKLHLVDCRAFVNVTTARISIVNNAELEYLDPKAFKNVKNLKVVDVSNNSLHVLPKSISKLPGVEEIHAAGNSLYCNCNLQWTEETSVKLHLESTSEICGGSQKLQSVCSPRLLYRSPNATTISEGSSTTFRCKFGGLPAPTVKWLYGDRPIPLGTSMETVNGDLVIKQSRWSHGGVYKCVGENGDSQAMELFYLNIIKDNARIVVIKTGVDFVEFSWRSTNQYRRYKAILIDVKSNNQTSFAIKQFTRSRHSQSGYVISDLESDTTYRVCLAYVGQVWADSEKCETFTTLGESSSTSRGITDYSLYGIIVASIVSTIFICVIVCVCITSRNYASRKKQQMRHGMVSESSYGLMTTSFSQRSGISSLYDNPAASVTPVSHLSRNSSCQKHKRMSAANTPTSPTVCFAPDVHVDDGTGMITGPKRTVSEPLLCSSTP